MNGAALAPGLLFAAVGLALSYAAARRLLGLGLVVLTAAALIAANSPAPSAWLEPAMAGCWLSILAAAACVHLPRGLGRTATIILSLNGGTWAGLTLAASGAPVDLWKAAPWALLCLPGFALVARGKGVAVKVMLSWLAAAAVLSLGLNMTPTLGYEPDHMG